MGTKFVGGVGAVMLAVVMVFAGTGVSQAQSGSQNFTLPAGGRATIQFEAYCTNYGLKFPTAIQAPNDVANARTQGALAYIQSNNLGADPANALEAQYAIWQLNGATGSPQGGQTTTAVVNGASTAPATPQGTSLVQAAQAGQVRVTITNWQPVGEKVQIGNATDNFYGRGTLTVENTSNQELTLYMPVGTLFPPATAGEQTMAGFQTSVQVAQTQPTAAATTAATAAATTAATAAATAAPTTTAATATPGTLPSTGGAGTNASLVLLLGALLLGSGMLLVAFGKRNA